MTFIINFVYVYINVTTFMCAGLNRMKFVCIFRALIYYTIYSYIHSSTQHMFYRFSGYFSWRYSCHFLSLTHAILPLHLDISHTCIWHRVFNHRISVSMCIMCIIQWQYDTIYIFFRKRARTRWIHNWHKRYREEKKRRKESSLSCRWKYVICHFSNNMNLYAISESIMSNVTVIMV